LALADVLLARGERVRFVTRQPTDSVRAELSARGMEWDVIDPDGLNEGDWATRLDGARWLVVDHYELDAAWERTVRPHVPRIMAIDDLAREHDCDVLLDQNLIDGAEHRYAGKLPSTCRTLLGLPYALLRAEFARHRAGPRTGPIRSVMLSFGGSDPPNETMKAFEALNGRALEVRIVTGDLNPHLRELERLAATLHVSVDNMAELLAASDLVIGAVGSSTWERFCVGVPSITASLALNQEPIAAALARRRLLRYLGRSSDTTVASYAKAVDDAIADPAPLRAMAATASLLVDGLGAGRVADVLQESS
jgi:UDP-2,4-diacetamido-2,4,6-trideoxy-beta-L-altropyranose hydrolase